MPAGSHLVYFLGLMMAIMDLGNPVLLLPKTSLDRSSPNTSTTSKAHRIRL